jgi:hypothetical protein
MLTVAMAAMVFFKKRRRVQLFCLAVIPSFSLVSLTDSIATGRRNTLSRGGGKMDRAEGMRGEATASTDSAVA